MGSKNKTAWLETLKTSVPTDAQQYASAAYTQKGGNLALDVNPDDEALSDPDEWTFGKEAYNEDPGQIVPIKLVHAAGVEDCLEGNPDTSHCYLMRLSLKQPIIKADTVHALLTLFPPSIGNTSVKGGAVMHILGFDNYFWSHLLGVAVFDVYMHDDNLELVSYAGNYGGRGSLRPLHGHYPLTVIETPEWIWTHEKQSEPPTTLS